MKCFIDFVQVLRDDPAKPGYKKGYKISWIKPLIK